MPQEDVEDSDPKSVVVGWNEDTVDIPDAWKAVVMCCLERDPNKRVGLTDLVQFWEVQKTSFGEDV